ncbi:hypothetical protein QUA20_25475 [Microcoleus sp. Pol7_A1]|uniref:hypothetical protein n=1 Tax=Microcoleus sp. Pol7_A1 TaxID=2818893 RepID=UPI002FCE853A
MPKIVDFAVGAIGDLGVNVTSALLAISHLNLSQNLSAVNFIAPLYCSQPNLG